MTEEKKKEFLDTDLVPHSEQTPPTTSQESPGEEQEPQVVDQLGVMNRKMKCSKGHEWVEEPWTMEILTFTLQKEPEEGYCLRCFRDFCRKYVGTVSKA